jgi:hypothetical protein
MEKQLTPGLRSQTATGDFNIYAVIRPQTGSVNRFSLKQQSVIITSLT